MIRLETKDTSQSQFASILLKRMLNNLYLTLARAAFYHAKYSSHTPSLAIALTLNHLN